MSEAPEIVWIRWRDSLTGVGGWHPIGDAKSHAAEAWGRPLHAAGFLVESTPEYVVVASGFNPVHEGEPEVNGTVMIPRSEIVTITTVAHEWEAAPPSKPVIGGVGEK